MFKTSVTTRFIFVALLSLALMIPLLFVSGLVDERAAYQAEVTADIAASWGGSQSLVGPFLVIPETYPSIEKKDNHTFTRQARRVRIYTPDQFTIRGRVQHEMRKRALYEVPVYSASLDLEANFTSHLETPQAGVKPLLNEARLILGLSDTTGINELTANKINFTSGTGEEWLGTGVQAILANVGSPLRLDIQLQLNGTHDLRVAPVGSATQIDLSSSWPHPSFSGRYLPHQHEISSQGFKASWRVSELARDLPRNWIVGDTDTYRGLATADIALFQPVTNYSLVDRGTKYALIFIALTFLAYLCFELRTGIQLHYVQYGVVGAALVLFYLTLLSLSEHISFGAAYTVATSLLVGLISWYTWLVTKAEAGITFASTILGLLLALYACLYVLLMLEDAALLVGTAILLLGLAALMYATKDLKVPLPTKDGSA